MQVMMGLRDCERDETHDSNGRSLGLPSFREFYLIELKSDGACVLEKRVILPHSRIAQ